jgi:peptidoglycan/LPS O-acetylase OafA/YrhL
MTAATPAQQTTTSTGPPVPLVGGSGSYPALTGLRAIAALAVVATHAAYWTGRYADHGTGLVWARLEIGVAIFFALSGFLLFRPWVAALAAGGAAPSTRGYLVKRALRVLPAYWVTVVLAYVLVPSTVGTGGEAFVRSLTLTQVYGADLQHLGLTQMWSLTAEVAFYLLLPLLALMLCRGLAGGRWRPARLYAGCLLLAAAGVGWLVLTRTAWEVDASAIWWLPNYLAWFAGGMALAVAAVRHELGTEPPGRFALAVEASPGSVLVVAAGLFVVAATPVAGAATTMPWPVWDSVLKSLLYAAASVLLLAPLVLGTGTRATAWLVSGPMQLLGRISYPIFLLHLIVIEGVMRALGYPVFTGSTGYVLAGTLAATLPLAWLMHRLVERPVSRWRPGRSGAPAARPPRRPGSAPG